MLCVCLSFPITELCLLKRRSDAFLISAFLTDEEQALTGGTHCVLKHCLSSHSQFTSDTEHCCSRAAATAFIYIQPHIPVIKCVVPTCSGLSCSDAKTNEIRNRIYLKEKTGRSTLILSTACKQYKWPLFPRHPLLGLSQLKSGLFSYPVVQQYTFRNMLLSS